MAIRYDKSYNAEIARTVKNFNQKRNRAIKRGFKSVPAPIKVSDLKARYTTRDELNKQLTQLRKFSGKEDLLKKVENQGGASAIEWEFGYLKSNLKSAKDYFEGEYKRVSKRVGKFPGERIYLDTIASKIKLLDLNIDYMTQSQFRSTKSAISEFFNAPANRKAQYRGFLSEVEWVMEKTGISQEIRDNFFDKFSSLTVSQFMYAYDNNDIIDKIYKLYVKQGENEPYLSDPDDAKVQLEQLINEVDSIVEDAKLNAD